MTTIRKTRQKQSYWAIIGEEAAVVSQVAGSVTRRLLLDQGGDLKLDASDASAAVSVLCVIYFFKYYNLTNSAAMFFRADFRPLGSMSEGRQLESEPSGARRSVGHFAMRRTSHVERHHTDRH